MYPDSEITSEREDGYHRIRVMTGGKPEHFDIILDENNYKSRAIMGDILALANTVSVTVLFPSQRVEFDEFYKTNLVDISKGQMSAIPYD